MKTDHLSLEIDDCNCLGCQITTIANQTIVNLVELHRIQNLLTNGESDGVVLQMTADVGEVRDFLIGKFMEAEHKKASN